MMLLFYSRKSPRIPNYDYSGENFYFITICTYNRRCIFGSPEKLNPKGEIAKVHMEQLDLHYSNVRLDKYVIMPNHIHLILQLTSGGGNNAEQIIAQYKSGVSREIRKNHPGMRIWQRSFHDHVIRCQEDYERIWNYIDGNPQCWDKDCFYVDPSIIQGE